MDLTGLIESLYLCGHSEGLRETEERRLGTVDQLVADDGESREVISG